ncbi:MAG: hypothetical protein ACO37Z_13100 [Burkholderiaceae bacterium]|jgi:hypothetical protein
MTTRRLGDFCAFVIAAWAFAMLGIEAGAHHGTTHSGTQPAVEVKR